MTDAALVTGAGGFLGRALTRRLRESRPGRRVWGADLRAAPGPVKCFRVDFRDGRAVRRLLAATRPSLIFHCAGTTAPGPWPLLAEVHVLATAHLLEAVRETAAPRPRVVLLGSAAEYGDVPASRQPISETETPRPASPYAVSKLCQTRLAQAYAQAGVNVTIARLFNLLDPGVPETFSIGRFAALLRRARRRPGFTAAVGPLSAVRDFVSVSDVCEALERIGERGRPGEIYNVCSGRGVSLRDLWNRLVEKTGVQVRVRGNARGSARTSVLRCVGNPAKIKRHTGWRPRETISESLDVIAGTI